MTRMRGNGGKVTAGLAPAILAVSMGVVGAVAAPRAGSAEVARGDARPATAAPALQRRPASSAAVDPRSGGFQVALGEWRVTLEAKAIRPGPVTFVVTNRGKLVHGFELYTGGSGDEDGDEGEVETRTLRPGETARLTVNMRAGSYEFECFVGDHDDLGMRGILSVRPDAPLIAPPAASKGTVAIKGFAFVPAVLRVPAGTTVRWRNEDPAPHTVTANNRAFDSTTMLQRARYSRRFARRGTYAYLCTLHPQMTGRVVVR